MNWPLLWVLLLLISAIIMFVRNKPGMDAVALIMVAALPLTGVISVPEALAGFSDPNIVLVAFLFVLGEGLVRTGIARQLGDWINRKSAGNNLKLLLMLMTAVAGMGAIMSSTAIVAIFIPVVFRICRQSGMSPAGLMMPMSFAALISGMLTLISTSPNLVVNAELIRQGNEGLGFFTVTPVGLAVLILGLIYMAFARKWIPERNTGDSTRQDRPGFCDWIEKYQLADRECRVRVMPGSLLIGKPLAELDLHDSGIHILAAERRARLIRPRLDFIPQIDDILLLDVKIDSKIGQNLINKYQVEMLKLDRGQVYFTDFAQDLGMAEAIVPAESEWVNKSIRRAGIRTETGLTVIGLRRANGVTEVELPERLLSPGDTLLLTGFWKDIQRLKSDRRRVVLLDLPQEFDDVLPVSNKGVIALVILGLVIGAMITGILPNVQAVLIGCLLMGLFGVLDMKSAYQSVNWKVLVLIVGMMPFSLALQKTGGVDLAADAILSIMGGGSIRLALAVVFLATAVMGLFISNTATAVLMAPVAFAIAAEMGVSPRPFALTVMLAASAAFMTPVSSPVNTLVVSPGNYRFSDFVRVGVPFTVIVLIVTVVLVPWLLPV